MASTASTPRKEKRLSVRATEPEKAPFAKAAQARRMNVSQFVLQASLDAARTILADHTEFRLPPDQWGAFCQRLDEPPRTVPALRKLFAEHEPF